MLVLFLFFVAPTIAVIILFKKLRREQDEWTRVLRNELLALRRDIAAFRGEGLGAKEKRKPGETAPPPEPAAEGPTPPPKVSTPDAEKVTTPISAFAVKREPQAATGEAAARPKMSPVSTPPPREPSRWEMAARETLHKIWNWIAVGEEHLQPGVSKNRDSPPLDIVGIELTGNVYQLIFLASPEHTYELHYGNPNAEATSFDTEVLRELLSQRFATSKGEFGERIDHGEISVPVQWTDFLSNPVFLFVTVVVLVIALGFGLYQATKRVDNLTN